MAEVTTTNLELQIKNAAGKAKVVRVPEPSLGLDRVTTEKAAHDLIEANIFVDDSGDPYVTNVGARYVKRTVDEIYNVENEPAV